MKFVEITEIEYNALKEENFALKKELKDAKKKREQERIKPVSVSISGFKTYPSFSLAINDIGQTLAKIDELIQCTLLQLAEAESKASYFEARYAEELKSTNRCMVFGSTKKSKDNYTNMVQRCKTDINMLKKSKENFEKLLEEVKKRKEKSEKENYEENS